MAALSLAAGAVDSRQGLLLSRQRKAPEIMHKLVAITSSYTGSGHAM